MRNSPVTGEFPAQRASNAENVCIWLRHHDNQYSVSTMVTNGLVLKHQGGVSKTLMSYYWRVYMKDKSSVHFIFYIVESSHAHHTAYMHDPHSYMGTVDTLQWEQERENDVWWIDHWMRDRGQLAAGFYIAQCNVSDMFRPCTHLSDHDTWSNQKVTWSNTCPSRDWPYVMSRQNNQTERDQFMVNSLLYEWCTFPWL